jgi:hypothetical protein
VRESVRAAFRQFDAPIERITTDKYMSTEKKTRQRLTMTAMYEAIVDIDAALQTPTPPIHHERSIMLVKRGKAFLAQLVDTDPDSDEVTVLDSSVSDNDFEESVAQLLEEMKTKFEEKKKSVLLGLDAVLERHHGALRGARSKIREKKA